MKRITLMTKPDAAGLASFLGRNLKEVLGGCVDIQDFYGETQTPAGVLDADIVLVMLRDQIADLGQMMPELRRFLVVHRTLRKSELYRLFAIPEGTRVLVVNDHPVTTMETVALMHELEINHLQFVPFREGHDYPDIDVAVTPAERDCVPGHIRTVIDVGHRCIDISTFLEIINRLGIADPEVTRRLLRYSETIVTLDRGIDLQFKELVMRNNELDTVINLTHEGLLLLNPVGRIAVHNRALGEMLNLRRNLQGASISELPPEIRALLEQEHCNEWRVDCQGRSLVVSRQKVEHLGLPAGQYFNFHEVTYTRQLEQSLNRSLREKGQIARYCFKDVLTRSPRMIQCIDLARRMALSDFTVLIIGESGTGKELMAQSIHTESSRGRQPFVAVNCAAVPEQLLESELFGYTGGSFTGALKEGKEGLFEQANNGTVFLDEIGDMPLMLQAKLLRVLQEHQIVRVGSNKVIDVNIRVIAATNCNLRERVRDGRFREDLYYRLNALPLEVPPLRERPDDIFPLLEHFLGEKQRFGLSVTEPARSVLQDYSWPGNIRELNNVAIYIAFLGGDVVDADSLPKYLFQEILSFEREQEALVPHGGLDRARAVLKVLAESAKGAGRRRIRERLASRGPAPTEAEIRTLLGQLNELGLVRSEVGRHGSELTSRGRLFLKSLP
jgi:transcriptional regulator with PAS, ATPase and Fis domain